MSLWAVDDEALWWWIEYAKSPNLKKKYTFGEKDPQKLA